MKKGKILLPSITGIAAGVYITCKFFEKILAKTDSLSNKHLALFLMMNQWVKVKQEGKSLADYFKDKGYKKIAIYGMSYAGETLWNDLNRTNIEVAYGIDKNTNIIYQDIDIKTMEDDLEKVDAIVVTPVSFFEEIKQKLNTKIECPVISLEDILYEMD